MEKIEGKKLGQSRKKKSGALITDFQKNSFTEQLKAATAGLYYISETDAEIVPFKGNQAQSTSKETVLVQTQSASDVPVEERNFTEFFARFTEIQDWFGDEEKETARKFTQLKELLEKNLKDLKVFKVGRIQLDVYVVGLDAENNLVGIKTKAVET